MIITKKAKSVNNNCWKENLRETFDIHIIRLSVIYRCVQYINIAGGAQICD